MKRIHIKTGIVLLLIGTVFHSCNPPWQDHYENQEEQINMKLWDAIRQEGSYSTFVSLVEAEGLDSIFLNEQVYTLFVPANEAFESLPDTISRDRILLQYHMLQTLFVDESVENWRRMLTGSGKYALVEKNTEGYSYDGSPMIYSSPLFQDGKYYEISKVAVPKPNLYEFTAEHSNVLKEYIDSKDSVYLDRNLSRPIGFDEDGNTIYDSVFGMVNLFEAEFFPLSEEFRDENATLILFTQEQYDLALDDMASRLGGSLTGHEDIPYSWQNDVLLPELTRISMFDGILSYSDLQVGKIKSITGDTVMVEAEKIDPDSRTVCSNGVGYIYSEFTIHDTLFRGENTREGESMIQKIGEGKYAWNGEVKLTGPAIAPTLLIADAASEGELVNVSFLRDYQGEYSMEFAFRNVFPMRYRLEWRANSRPSGIYEVYVNDQLLTFEDKFGFEYTEFDTNDLKYSVVSVTGDRFLPVEGFNIKDYWVDHLTDYGDVNIRFVYKGPGASSTNGFNIDFIKLIPVY